jgi:tRNA A-37 threonylcarbamoyl transferase component Bud32/tetratricopeptide (TPR) repeat protein
VSLARDPRETEILVDLVARGLAQIDAGEAVDADALCAGHPHLAPAVAELLGMQRQLPSLQQAALREDPFAGALLAGRYKLAACLGRGAMGVVYRGDDQELRRSVAVKILDVRLFRDAEAERRFQREAEALAMLQHPNVVGVYDRGRTPEGVHFLVMELLEGATLAALLQRVDDGEAPLAAVAAVCGPQPSDVTWPRLCARWVRELAHGLGAAHERGLVHRDVKPSNVFVDRAGRPVMLDFGIAAQNAAEKLTATQTTLGTPWYMAPEQLAAAGLGEAKPTLDVYGLGATLYHLLAGRTPYEGDVAQVLAALQTRDPAPLASLRPGLPRDLVAIVERCLERDPARRYATAKALAADLDAFLQHLPVTARPIGAFGRRWRAWRRAPAKPIAAAAAALLLVGAVFVAPIVVNQRAEARAAERRQLYATLPSLLAIEGWPDERILGALHGEHRGGIALLDNLLALDASDLPALLFRACLRQDLGDRDGAAADFAAIARADGSPYLQALAARYAAADPARAGAKAIDTKGLPEPATPPECFVAGYHELRQSDVAGFAERADALFARAADAYAPARDGRLFSLAALCERRQGEEQAATIKQLYDETVALEAIYGGRTARTCAMRGVALMLRRDYRAAVPEFEASLALRADRHGPHQNLGVAHLRLGDLFKAEHHLIEALRVRPFAWNTRFTLAQLLRTRGDFAGAHALAERLEKTGLRGEAWKQPDLVGSIAQAEALALRGVDVAASRAAAARAVAAYDEALAVRATAEARQRREIAVALLEDRPQAAFVPFARTLLADPDNAYQLANLAFLMPPGGLDAEQTAWLAAIVRQLARQKAVGDERFQRRLQDEIESGLQPFR